MGRRSGKDLDELGALLAGLRAADAPVVVEGMRDEAALRALGITAPVLRLHSGVPILHFCEKAARRGIKRVILLTDWDRKGRVLFHRLLDGFRGCSVECDIEPWLKLGRLLAGEVREVEGMPGVVERLLGEIPQSG